MKLQSGFFLILALTLVSFAHSGNSENSPTDPKDWIVTSPAPGESWVTIATHQGVTVLGSLSGAIYYSTDLITWNQAERPGYSPMWHCVSTGAGFLGAAGSMLLSSEDGIHWENFPVDNIGVTQISTSEYEDQWVLTEALYGSSILINDMAQPLIDNYPARNLFSDAENSLPNLTTLQEFHNIRGEFVMGVGEFEYREPIDDATSTSFVRGWVARFPDIYREPDVVPDPLSVQFASGPVYSLAFSDDVFVMTGAELESRVVKSDSQAVGPDRQILSGKMYRSENSIDWTTVEIDEMPVFYEILYRNQRFVAVGKEGWIWTSEDGVNWNNRIRIEEESEFQALHYTEDGTWMVAGTDGVFATASVQLQPSAIPTVSIRTQGIAVEGDPTQKATVFLKSDTPLNSKPDNILEYSSIEGIADVLPATGPNAIAQFTAIYDQLYEGDQFIEVSLKSDSPDFRIGIPNKARIRISDAATDRWRQKYFPNLEFPEKIYDSQDYDQDGFSNLLERFFGTDPLSPNSADDFKIYWAKRDGNDVLEAMVSEDILDLNVRLEISQDGSEWTPVPIEHQPAENSPAEPAEGAIRETVYWQISNQGIENALIRLSADRRQ